MVGGLDHSGSQPFNCENCSITTKLAITQWKGCNCSSVVRTSYEMELR